ncbi:PspC domain-containing protein [uncultured Tenacibaculum sp.]|uniref:PspC domain-containing protein n=1 Tax=uncultured Tenacibaculum sp. TaxID=174713 RepID=UPI002632E3AE|nr:PspC domain-containing protein [uncultured Tenacibaculum sp.]
MNKTININLGGFFFHIDENAYQKLKRYLDAISRSLSDDPQGKNEIISDIEARISELLSERITDARQVVNEGDIDEVIAIMGQPEDYTEAEESYSENYTYTRKRNPNKKLFRDSDSKFLGGVASGLAHYVNVDTIWIRLAFILAAVTTGIGVLAYIILWVLLPEARTTTEKLQMEGEPVNIDSIEKKIRNEFEFLSTKLKDGANELTDKISSTDYDKLRTQTKSGLQDFLDTVGKILSSIFKVFGKFIGALLIFASGVTLVSLLFALFSISSLEILGFEGDMVQYPPFFYDSVFPEWILSIFGLLVVGIPFFALFILGLRILSPNIKRINTATTLTLFGIWLASLLLIGFSGLEYATSRARTGIKASTKTIEYNVNNPLKIGVKNNNDIYYLHNLERRRNSKEVYVDDKKMKYSNNVKIDVEKSESNKAYIEIKKESKGRKNRSAAKNAEKIKYKFDLSDNKIVFDAYFLSDFKNIWKREEVYLTLFIPEGTTIFFENSSKRFLYEVENTDDIYDRDMSGHHFKMTSKGLECIDCKSSKKETSGWNKDQDDDSDEWTKDSTEDTNNNSNDDELTFLFDSTINDIKAEFIISKQTTEEQLNRLIDWFKDKKNIDIEIYDPLYTQENTIKRIKLKIDCNDGHKGELKITNGTLQTISKGFLRNYEEEDGILAFKTW